MAVSVVAVICGFVMAEPGLVQLGLLGLLILGGSQLWAGRNLRHLTFIRTTPECAFASRPFPLKLTIANGRRHLDAFAVEFEDSVAGAVEKGLHVDWLPAGDSASREIHSRINVRGTHHRAHTAFESQFPFGLWKSRVALEGNLEMMVFPRPVPPRMLEDTEVLTWLDQDAVESELTDWDGDFHGLREFQPGDRMKLIHWPTSARSRNLVVRQFDRRRPSRITLIFHSIRPDAKPQPGSVFESSMELLCGLLLFFRERGTPLDMIASFNQWRTLQVDTEGQLDVALRTLAVAKRSTERTCEALNAALSGLQAEHRVIVFSDVPLKEWECEMPELPCVTICLSTEEIYIRQPLRTPLKPIPTVQVQVS